MNQELYSKVSMETCLLTHMKNQLWMQVVIYNFNPISEDSAWLSNMSCSL